MDSTLVKFYFIHLIFVFWFLVTFGNKVTKISCNLYLHFVGQDGKNPKENHETKVTKIPKTKRRKYGMNETLIMTRLLKWLSIYFNHNNFDV